jgi:hypothetical protein
MTIEVTWEPHGVYRKFTGRLTADAMQTSSNAIFLDARFPDIRYLINDYTEAELDESIDQLTVQVAARIASAAAGNNPNLRFAIVSIGEKAKQLVEFVQSLAFAAQVPYRAFPTITEARAWVETESLIA